jgi:hypothetical protein
MRNAVADLVHLSEKAKTEYFSFSDEYLTIRQLTELVELLNSADLDIRWFTFARMEPGFKDARFCRRLYEAGCRMLMFGMESASQKVLSAMRKGTSVSDIIPILHSCKHANIAVRLDLMIGFPGETEEDVEATYDFIVNNQELIDTPFSNHPVAIFEMQKGTPVMLEPERYGVQVFDKLRGDLDYRYRYQCKNGLDSYQKAQWREKFLRFFKTQTNAELICPPNKTHEFILKDLFDSGLLSLPVTTIRAEDFHRHNIWWPEWVEISENPCSRGFLIRNLLNNGVLQIDQTLAPFVAALRHRSHSLTAFEIQSTFDLARFSRLLDFLNRNDYIVIEQNNSSLTTSQSECYRSYSQTASL